MSRLSLVPWRFRQGATPAVPPSGDVDLYAKTDGRLYCRSGSGGIDGTAEFAMREPLELSVTATKLANGAVSLAKLQEALATLLTAPPARSLIGGDNASFEGGVGSWVSYAFPSVTNPPVLSSVADPLRAVGEGSKVLSAAITDNAGHAGARLLAAAVPNLTGGQQYTIRAYVGASVATTAHFIITWVGGNVSSLTVPVPATGMVPLHVTFTMPSTLAVNVHIRVPTQTNVTLYVDEVSIHEGPGIASTSFVMPWQIDVPCAAGSPYSQTNWDNCEANSAAIGGGYLTSSGAQNAKAGWQVAMEPGTWTLELMHTKEFNRGIYTVAVGGVTVGTIDGYNAGVIYNMRSAITGIVIQDVAPRLVELTLASKNAASSGYYGTVQSIRLRRTA